MSCRLVAGIGLINSGVKFVTGVIFCIFADKMKRLAYTSVMVGIALHFVGCNADDGSGRVNANCDFERVITASGLSDTLLRYKGMTVSFNSEKHVPNGVAWELTGGEADGSEPRAQDFMVDTSVEGCANPWDYSYSGYDRGHMAPAGDMKWDAEAMAQSFYMTNICPQVKSLNSGAWKRLEEKCRNWARIDSAIVIVAGPVLSDDLTETIGRTGVIVPQRFFKVILSPYANPPRGIGFIMNNGYVDGGMQSAAVSIDSVERVTGHDFFSELPDSIEDEVESQCRFHYWSTLKSR